MNNSESVSKKNKANGFLSWIVTPLIAVLLTLVFVNYVGQIALVIGDSMSPTLHNGNVVFLQKTDRNFERFDIVAADINSTNFIKRIVGLPGETVQIVDNTIFINGSPIQDVVNVEMVDYGIAAEPVKLSETQYFIMGDNRNDSYDSRNDEFGPIEVDSIRGGVAFSLVPFITF